MSGDGNNSVSYQKNGAAPATVGSNGNGYSTPASGLLGGWKKWGLGAILVAILATVYSFSSGSSPSTSKNAIEKQMVASDLSFDSNGKLKLFDSLSKFLLFLFGFSYVLNTQQRIVMRATIRTSED